MKKKIADGWDFNQTVEPGDTLVQPHFDVPDNTARWPIIIVACYLSNAATLDLLIKRGANVNAKLPTGFNCVAAVLVNREVGNEREAMLKVGCITGIGGGS